MIAIACVTVLTSRAAAQGRTAAPESVLQETTGMLAQATALQGERRYAEAISVAENALLKLERALGRDDLFVAMPLLVLSQLYENTGDERRSGAAAARALAIAEKQEGPASAVTALVLQQVGAYYYMRGDSSQALTALNRSLAIRESVFGGGSIEVADAVCNIGSVHQTDGRLNEAESAFRRCLTIRNQHLGGGHERTASAVESLAEVEALRGHPHEAIELYRRVLETRERAMGPRHESVADVLTHMAAVYQSLGDPVSGEALLQRALLIWNKDPSRVAALLGMGELYESRADWERAQSLFEQALPVSEEYGNSSYAITALRHLAQLHLRKHDSATAQVMLQAALKLAERHRRNEIPFILEMLAGLADVQGDRKNAEALYLQALGLLQGAGAAQPRFAQLFGELGAFYSRLRSYQRAEPLLRKSLSLWEQSLGERHPRIAAPLGDLAIALAAAGSVREAAALMARKLEIEESALESIVAAGSERQKRAYMSELAGSTEAAISFHLQSRPADGAVARATMAAVLRRKGRVLDVLAGSAGRLRRFGDAADIDKLDQLAALRTLFAVQALGTAPLGSDSERRAELERVAREIERLEASVSSRSIALGGPTPPVTVDAVQAAMPAGSALVEWVVYHPTDAGSNKPSPARYAAYVLLRDGDPRGVDLGDASRIERHIADLRRGLRQPGQDARAFARILDEDVMRPLRPLLSGANRVFLSPESALNLVPFEALVDEQQRFLVERFTLTYVTSGRDLLRRSGRTTGTNPPLILADPQFGTPGRVESLFSALEYSPIPGTRQEAEQISRLLPDARVLTGAQATEQALKGSPRPRILHLATHGFFLEDDQVANSTTTRLLSLMPAAAVESPNSLRLEGNPMLRSGLVLAGVRRHASGPGEDGVLTALEAAGLDLYGTKVVVLSACDTGVGEATNGEGVYGLRRALVLAGSESQIISLWPVDDEATRRLMLRYYAKLQAGISRADALRTSQLEMLRSQDHSHPYYWAAFIQSGAWTAVDLAQ